MLAMIVSLFTNNFFDPFFFDQFLFFALQMSNSISVCARAPIHDTYLNDYESNRLDYCCASIEFKNFSAKFL